MFRLIICPNLIAVGISQALPASSADFLRQFCCLGLIHTTVAGFLTQFARDRVTLGDHIVLRAAHGSPGLQEFHVSFEIVRIFPAGQVDGLVREFIGVVQRLHVFLLHAVFLRDLLGDLLQAVNVRLEFGRRTSFRLQELDHIICKMPVLLDPFHVMLDKIDHVVQGPFDIFLLGDLFARFKDRLDDFRAATGAGAMNPCATPAMMRAQFSTGNVEDGIGH